MEHNKKALQPARLSTFILILMVAAVPLAQSSRLRARTLTVEENPNTKGLRIVFGNGGGEGKVAVIGVESARQVPAGPDPLHHNTNPIAP